MKRGSDHAIAMAVALLMTSASLVWLRSSLPRAAPGEYVESEPLIVTWIVKGSPAPDESLPRTAAPNAVARVRRHRPVRGASTSAIAHAPPPVSNVRPSLSLQLPEAQPSFHADPMRRTRAELAANNPLPGLNVRDSSFLARLGGMSAASACGELRALLARGGFDAPNPDVILRSMQARGCAP